jgi:hypothetical protein
LAYNSENPRAWYQHLARDFVLHYFMVYGGKIREMRMREERPDLLSWQIYFHDN